MKTPTQGKIPTHESTGDIITKLGRIANKFPESSNEYVLLLETIERLRTYQCVFLGFHQAVLSHNEVIKKHNL